MIKYIVRRSVKSLVRPQKPKVDFVIAGAQKAGTSALDAYLREYPEICMADRKEVHFFDREYLFRSCLLSRSKRFLLYPFYHSYFHPKAHHRVLGESTPIYMYWMDAPRRIWEYNSGMKIIVILRNPINRAFSHWNMERDRKADGLQFWDALQQERQRCREALPYQHRVFSYVDRGFYTEQLRRIWRYFPQKQTLILKNEDLRSNPSETLEKVTDFLGLNISTFAALLHFKN